MTLKPDLRPPSSADPGVHILSNHCRYVSQLNFHVFAIFTEFIESYVTSQN